MQARPNELQVHFTIDPYAFCLFFFHFRFRFKFFHSLSFVVRVVLLRCYTLIHPSIHPYGFQLIYTVSFRHLFTFFVSFHPLVHNEMSDEILIRITSIARATQTENNLYVRSKRFIYGFLIRLQRRPRLLLLQCQHNDPIGKLLAHRDVNNRYDPNQKKFFF